MIFCKASLVPLFVSTAAAQKWRHPGSLRGIQHDRVLQQWMEPVHTIGEPEIFAHPTGEEQDHFPLLLCEGDCDTDSDCAEGLGCFVRETRYAPVPGCSGGDKDWSLMDYCTNVWPRLQPSMSSVPSRAPSTPFTAPTFSTSGPTTAPVDIRIELGKDLFAYEGGTPPSEAFPLGLCMGDCDKDDHCAGDMICFQRDGYQEVPGCNGGSEMMSVNDFCTNVISVAPSVMPSAAPSANPSTRPSAAPSPIPSTTPVSSPSAYPSAAPSKSSKLSVSSMPSAVYQLPELFVYEGDTPTAASFPLGLCMGDCDEDIDCEGDMVCFERGRYDDVPGCNGGSAMWTLSDFCTNVTSIAPSVSPSDSPTPSSSPVVSPNEPTEERSALLAYGDPGGPPLSAFPLPACTGDCDGDEDCAKGLQCFIRVRNQEVPGCTGGKDDWSLTDYCVYPWSTSQPTTLSASIVSRMPSFNPIANPSNSPTSSPSTHPSPNPSSVPSSSPTAGPSAMPWSSRSASPSAVPSSISSVPYAVTTTEPSAAPSTKPSPIPTNGVQIGNEILPDLFAYEDMNPPLKALPLGRCTGDCDSDFECGEGLYCYDRGPGEEVPGCNGGSADQSDRDFCTGIEFAPVVPSNSTFFRIKLENQDTDWCIDCQNDCTVGDILYLRKCSGRSTYFELENIGFGDEVLIQASGTSVCLERRGDTLLELRVCNPGKVRQRFVAADNSQPFITETFEITQKGKRNFCVSPPTATFTDRVGMRDCTIAEFESLSEWSLV